MPLNDYNNEHTVTSRGAKHHAFVQAHKYKGKVFVEEVVAEMEGDKPISFNVTLDGNNLFSAAQTVTTTDTPQSFTPDQNRYASGDTTQLKVNNTTQATGSGTLNVGVGVRPITPN